MGPAPEFDDFPFATTCSLDTLLTEGSDPKLNSPAEDLVSAGVSLLSDMNANPVGFSTFSELGIFPKENEDDLADISLVPNADADAVFGLEFDPKANTELEDFSTEGVPNTNPDTGNSVFFLSELPKLNPPAGLIIVSFSESLSSVAPNLNPDVAATVEVFELKAAPNPVPPLAPSVDPNTAELDPESELPNLNPPASPKLDLNPLEDSGCLAPGFGVSHAAHLIFSAGFEIIQT